MGSTESTFPATSGSATLLLKWIPSADVMRWIGGLGSTGVAGGAVDGNGVGTRVAGRLAGADAEAGTATAGPAGCEDAGRADGCAELDAGAVAATTLVALARAEALGVE